jgi:hypothetical protein
MANAMQVRVIFYNSSTGAFADQCENENWSCEMRGNFNKALLQGERLLRQSLTVLFPEVKYLTIVQLAMQLSSPEGLRKLVGKTLVVVDPNEGMLRDFLEGYSIPEGSEIELTFQESHFDKDLLLVVEENPLRQESAQESAS